MAVFWNWLRRRGTGPSTTWEGAITVRPLPTRPTGAPASHFMTCNLSCSAPRMCPHRTRAHHESCHRRARCRQRNGHNPKRIEQLARKRHRKSRQHLGHEHDKGTSPALHRIGCGQIHLAYNGNTCRWETKGDRSKPQHHRRIGRDAHPNGRHRHQGAGNHRHGGKRILGTLRTHHPGRPQEHTRAHHPFCNPHPQRFDSLIQHLKLRAVLQGNFSDT